MTNTTRLIDYIGAGLFSARPSAASLGPTIPTGMLAEYYATDTGVMYVMKGGDTSWTALPTGTGTVTSVATGTGLSGGPVTSTGTISLANTAVTPGSYTSANITVDAQGRLTAAASGSGGGGSTGTAPTIRASSIYRTSGTSGSVPLPSGTVAGDTVFMFFNSGYAPYVPSGWKMPRQYLQSPSNSLCVYKEVTSSDITAGSVSVSFANNYTWSVVSVTIVGSINGLSFSENVNLDSNSILNGASWITESTPANALLLVAMACRPNVSNTCAEGTLLQTNSFSDGSIAVYAIPATDTKGITSTLTIPSISTLGASVTRMAFNCP